ncbi:MAG: DUF3298 and DUF4163 domain-containing protein [Clostridium sp.]|uniref:DUF3298 and DUF4163 domain-containing protein n=1 Tax=Clostridium sp. TaxID=1506 RepID=UPI003EE5D315
MIKKASTLMFKKICIIFLLTFSTQCLWITSYAVENNEIVEKKNYSSTKCLIIDISIPYIQAHYGIMANEIIGERTNGYITEISKGAEEYKKSGMICNIPYEVMSNYKITKNDSNLLSLYIEYYQFAGGAHGMTYKNGYNIDKKTGQLLNLSDLFKENYNYKEKIDLLIRDEINKDKEKYFDGGADFKGIDNKTRYYLKDNNLVIYYGLYEIAPYASGIIEFNLNLDNFKDGLKYDKI